MGWAKLNVFQRLVRQWDALHPYNAAQLIRIRGNADISRYTESWRQTLVDLGLGRVRAAGRWYRFETLNGTLDDSGMDHPGKSLGSFMSDELNRPFDQENDIPLRPFVLRETDSHVLGVVYHHWVADSASIRSVLREWFLRTYDAPRCRRAPMRVPEHGYWHYFGPSAARWQVGRSVFDSLRWSSRMRRVRRVEVADYDRYDVHFSSHQLPEGLIDPLLPAARRAGATLNDIFLAAIALVCDRHAPVRRTSRREDLALGTIVDLRSRSESDMSDLFGLFLGFTSIVCRPAELVDWDRLVRRVAVQNRMQRDAAVAQASMIRMFLGLGAHRVLGRRIKEFYRKRMPLAGGVSNVNLNGSWVEQYHPDPILDYIRVSPCGPLLPVVFTPTTLGRRMNFGLTCRQSVIPPQGAEAMAASFRDRLVQFASGA